MLIRTARVWLGVTAMLVLFGGVRPAVCEGWSLLHPFSSDSTAQSKPPKPTPNQPLPTTGSKTFFSKVSDKITGKKPEPVKPAPGMYATPKPPVIQPPKQEKKSWLGSMFQPKEPEKAKSVPDWMKQPRVDL